MKAKITYIGIWRVLEICEDRAGQSLLRDFINGLGDKALQKQGAKMLARLEAIATLPEGPTRLAKDKSHEVNAQHKIFQFTISDIRATYFYAVDDPPCAGHDPRKTIILTHGFLKTKNHQTDEYDRAVRLKKEYLQSLQDGSFEEE